jgi:hypothetical protein
MYGMGQRKLSGVLIFKLSNPGWRQSLESVYGVLGCMVKRPRFANSEEQGERVREERQKRRGGSSGELLSSSQRRVCAAWRRALGFEKFSFSSIPLLQREI